MLSRRPLTLVIAALLASLSSAGQAASWSFNLETNPGTWTTGTSSSYGNVRSYSSSGMTLGVSAYSNTGTNAAATGLVTQDNSNGNKLETARLAYDSTWQGLGAYNRDAGGTTTTTAGTDFQETTSPEHAFDNNERADSVLMSFGSSVNLSSITFGWTTTDSDFFVLAYTGGGTPTLTDLTYANLTGWTLVGNYSNQGTSMVNLASPNPVSGTASVVSNSGISSSYWLIGAGGFTSVGGVNSGDKFGGSYLALDSTSSSKKFDYLKLTSVGVTGVGGGTGASGGSAPEPGSLALAGAAFLGMMGMRRRKAAV